MAERPFEKPIETGANFELEDVKVYEKVHYDVVSGGTLRQIQWEDVNGRNVQELAQAAQDGYEFFYTHKYLSGIINMDGKPLKYRGEEFDHSPTYYIDAKIITLEQLREEVPQDRFPSIAHERRQGPGVSYPYQEFIKTRFGSYLPLRENDRIIPSKSEIPTQ